MAIAHATTERARTAPNIPNLFMCCTKITHLPSRKKHDNLLIYRRKKSFTASLQAQGANGACRRACGLDGLRGGPSTAWKSESSKPEEPLRCIATGDPNIERQEQDFGRRSCRITSRSGSAPGKISEPVAEGQQSRDIRCAPKSDSGSCPASITLRVFSPSRPLTAGGPGFSPAVNSEIQATGWHH